MAREVERSRFLIEKAIDQMVAVTRSSKIYGQTDEAKLKSRPELQTTGSGRLDEFF